MVFDKIFLKILTIFQKYFPSKDGMALHLNKFGPPLSNNAMRKVWLVVAPWFVRRKRKCEKLKGRRVQRTNFDQKSSFEL